MKELSIDATVENIITVTEFVNDLLDAHDCPMKTRTQISIAIDELFGNIANYAYDGRVGDATVRVGFSDSPKSVSITFIDSGIPFNPLERIDPDITLSADERKIGGLGIFMVKKMMDTVTYQYQNNQNILCITKNF